VFNRYVIAVRLFYLCHTFVIRYFIVNSLDRTFVTYENRFRDRHVIVAPVSINNIDNTRWKLESYDAH